jgi:iron complex outermembrane recepter protein
MRSTLGVMIAVSAAAVLAAPVAQAQTVARFDIPAQPVETALVQFARQAHLSLAMPEHIPNVRSRAVEGALTPPEALDRLLSGTGLHFEMVGDSAVRIIAAPTEPATFPLPPAPSKEIIVTAARRDIALVDVPRSIAHLDGERLDQLPAGDTQSLSREASGLQFTDAGAGRNKIYMRGVSDAALTGSAQSTVGIYLDGVRLTYAAPDPQLRLLDVDGVDVLRGPQGALYGAGSIGGIVSITSNAPDPTSISGALMQGGEQVQTGETGRRSELVLNAPIVADRLALRLAAYDEESPGWLDNEVTGQTDANAMRRRGGRFSALWNIAPHWRLRGFAASQAIRADDASYLTLTPSGPARSAHLQEPYEDDFSLSGVTLNGRIGDLSLTSTTAMVRHEIDSLYDATGSFAAFGVDPSQVRGLQRRDVLDITVHETRLSAPRQVHIPWVLGFFYASGETQSDRTLRDGAFNAYALRRSDAIDEAAIFGEASWPLTQHLSLSTGLRLFQLDVDMHARTSEELLGLSAETAGQSSYTDSAPDIRLFYTLNDDVRFYIGAAEGYRGGGLNAGEPIGTVLGAGSQPLRSFAGDELWTYEAGWRIALFEGRLELDGALFYNEWERIQTDALIVDNLPYTGNVGRGRALGVEADIVYAPTEALTLRAHLLANDTDVYQPDASFPLASHAFPGVPDLAVSGSARYERPIGVDARLFGELKVAHISRSAADFASTARLDAYQHVGLSFGVSGRRAELLVYVDNLLDRDGATFSLANPYAPGEHVTRLRPRTLGAELRYRF